MKKIVIYTTIVCPYCVRAKSLLTRKGLEYTEINVNDTKTREEMIEKSGGMRTVPQIFINNQHIGGCDDLHALDKAGKLDEMVG